MSKYLLIVGNICVVFVFGACVSAPLSKNISEQSTANKNVKPIVGELIEGRYYCLPGCQGHKDKYSICSNVQLQEQLLLRSREYAIAMSQKRE
jgi:hypothetical protein